MSRIQTIRKRLYEIIFEADTRAGRIFDLSLIIIILISIFTVMLESYGSIRAKYAFRLDAIEWIITIIFTIEYLLRIWVTPKPLKYMLSFYGIIDLLALLPSYLTIFVTAGQNLVVIRLLRALRIFRILKMNQYTSAGSQIALALWKSKEKITVFMIFVLILSIIIGTLMYLIEGDTAGFTDIPTSIYWAIITLTTVGYGDLSPVTTLGKIFTSLVMVLGYSIIVVPTGIVTASLLSNRNRAEGNTQVCPNCLYDKHEDDADFCKKCGTSLDKKKLNE